MILKRLPNLKDVDFQQAKELAKAYSTASFKDLSVGTGIPSSTLQRMFTDPDYHPGAGNIPMLCNALGNTVMVDWMAEKLDARLVFNSELKPTEENIQQHVARVMKEFSEAMADDAEARMDGIYTIAELEILEADFNNVINAAYAARERIRKRRLELKMKEENNG
ncbi:MAG: phage regulatory CII family protein [Deferribacterales bacterium]